MSSGGGGIQVVDAYSKIGDIHVNQSDNSSILRFPPIVMLKLWMFTLHGGSLRARLDISIVYMRDLFTDASEYNHCIHGGSLRASHVPSC